MSTVVINASTLPPGFCHTSWPLTFSTFASLLSAELSGNLNTMNFGSSTPTPENQDKPWFRLTTNGAPDKWYVYYNGFWVAKHALPSGVITLWDGLEASIVTLDGGETGAVTELSGPFWERVTEFDARFPLGVGTLASGTAVAVGATGGAETVTLTNEQMPRHRHSIETRQYQPSGNPNNSAGNRILTNNDFNTAAVQFHTTFTGGDEEGENASQTNMPPYRGCFFLKRTGRLFHRV